MAIVVISENGVASYYPSANTPDFEGNPDALINPDLTLVSGVPTKYWKRVGDSVVEMTQEEKDLLATNELLARKNLADTYNIDIKTALTALVKVINLRLPSNKITKDELVEALKNEIL